MPLTRRELCSAFPVAPLPALLSVEDPSARQSSPLDYVCVREFARSNGEQCSVPGCAERQTRDRGVVCHHAGEGDFSEQGNRKSGSSPTARRHPVTEVPVEP